MMPQLPPGYAYVPAPLPPLPQTQLAPVDGPRREKLYARLQEVSTKMDGLERQRVSVGGPIVAMVLGFGSTVVATIVGLTAAESARQIKRGGYESTPYDSGLDFNDDGDVDRSDRKNWVRTARVGAGLSAAGFLVGLAGSASLQSAREARRKNQKQLAKLHEEHTSIRYQLDYGAQVSSNQLGVAVRSRF